MLSHVEDPRAFNCCSFVDQYALGLKRLGALPAQAVLLGSQAAWTFTLERELLQLLSGSLDATSTGVGRIIAQVHRSLLSLLEYRTELLHDDDAAAAATAGDANGNNRSGSSTSSSNSSSSSSNASSIPQRSRSRRPDGGRILGSFLDTFILHRSAQLQAAMAIKRRLRVASRHATTAIDTAWGDAWRVCVPTLPPLRPLIASLSPACVA